MFRGLAAATVIAGAAFLAAGFIYGDPRFSGLFEVSRGTGPGTAMAGQPGAAGRC